MEIGRKAAVPLAARPSAAWYDGPRTRKYRASMVSSAVRPAWNATPTPTLKPGSLDALIPRARSKPIGVAAHCSQSGSHAIVWPAGPVPVSCTRR